MKRLIMSLVIGIIISLVVNVSDVKADVIDGSSVVDDWGSRSARQFSQSANAVITPPETPAQIKEYILTGYDISSRYTFSPLGAAANRKKIDGPVALEFIYSKEAEDWGYVDFQVRHNADGSPGALMDLSNGISLHVFGPSSDNRRMKELGVTLLHADSTRHAYMPIHERIDVSNDRVINVDFSHAKEMGLDLRKIESLIFHVGEQFQNGKVSFKNKPGSYIYLDTLGILE